jgi:bla regulator protein BlaR1
MTLTSLHDVLVRAAPVLANHLWQSTLFLALIAAVVSCFTKNSARIRFGLWLAASAKFLIPFSLLAALGTHFGPPRDLARYSVEISSTMQQVSQPFTQTHVTYQPDLLLSLLPMILAAIWLCGSIAVLGVWWMRWRRISALLQRARPVTSGREIDALRRVESAIGISLPLRILLSQDSMEPGIFGILRPVLIWPQGISEHLTEAHLEAILTHELWHVRRRDNLAAVFHMAVEVAFWFHPLVWWLGAQLVEERERACDEEVLRLGNHSEVYAESILKACRFCVEAPLSCVAGIAGSNLTRRIARIMKFHSAQTLTLSQKLLLAGIASLTVAGPVAFGVFHAPRLNAQPLSAANAPMRSFDSASVKPSASEDTLARIEVHPRNFSYNNVTVRQLIEYAYHIKNDQIEGAPSWIDSDRYDVEGAWKDSPAVEGNKSAITGPPPLPLPPLPAGADNVPLTPNSSLTPGPHLTLDRPIAVDAMLQTLLAQRFNLKLTRESRDLPVYDLVVAGTGEKLIATPAIPPPPSFNGEPIISMKSMIEIGQGEVTISNGQTGALAGMLSEQLDHQVIDKTGLKGTYDMSLHWTPGQNATASLSEALQQQLGLNLQANHGPVDVLVVSQVEKPSEN